VQPCNERIFRSAFRVERDRNIARKRERGRGDEAQRVSIPKSQHTPSMPDIRLHSNPFAIAFGTHRRRNAENFDTRARSSATPRRNRKRRYSCLMRHALGVSIIINREWLSRVSVLITRLEAIGSNWSRNCDSFATQLKFRKTTAGLCSYPAINGNIVQTTIEASLKTA